MFVCFPVSLDPPTLSHLPSNLPRTLFMGTPPAGTDDFATGKENFSLTAQSGRARTSSPFRAVLGPVGRNRELGETRHLAEEKEEKNLNWLHISKDVIEHDIYIFILYELGRIRRNVVYCQFGPRRKT
ncbi:hypothetical protein V501_00511 [Pseudogymnoascus sp. VKM F-4519 (FW-2642)]|nr:hypothetical protein V501_00511 [Pseudogymnoascus sp. VKM F-4519 (FW-2642)]